MANGRLQAAGSRADQLPNQATFLVGDVLPPGLTRPSPEVLLVSSGWLDEAGLDLAPCNVLRDGLTLNPLCSVEQQSEALSALWGGGVEFI